ncbi:putative ribosomal protein S19/S15 [Helianthus annuus]|uniref:Ribosomal protein S19/S15 n=1 Tax=Helianthus annuus TaxID=4232 RepID=A0A9K3MZL4_HELAN|nr:putative ribosomal protein S19/S15 [Helianthus annuus]KAJ0508793.1 putative ribosomal protein S19/S15 [Helianthus annuus]
MADVEVDVAAAGAPKKRTFKKSSFRGVDLDALLDMSTDELVKLFTACARRRFQRGLKRKPMPLIKKLRKAEIYDAVCYCYMLFCYIMVSFVAEILY